VGATLNQQKKSVMRTILKEGRVGDVGAYLDKITKVAIEVLLTNNVFI
jgi:hypothetical protein